MYICVKESTEKENFGMFFIISCVIIEVNKLEKENIRLLSLSLFAIKNIINYTFGNETAFDS